MTGFVIVGALVVIAAACIGVIRYSDRRQLIRDAEREHRLLMRGDMTGIYGNFPPPAETRGMGIWGMDD